MNFSVGELKYQTLQLYNSYIYVCVVEEFGSLNEVIVLPLAFIASLFIYELRSR